MRCQKVRSERSATDPRTRPEKEIASDGRSTVALTPINIRIVMMWLVLFLFCSFKVLNSLSDLFCFIELPVCCIVICPLSNGPTVLNCA